jgi:homoserine dehydrogenase
MREIGVGLLGLGNVGAGVIKLLSDNAKFVEGRLGARPVVRQVAVRAREKKRLVDVDASLITTDVNAVIDRKDVDIVCELIGGDTDSKQAVLRAIAAGKHVVTANKALLAVHGDEIFSAAEKAKVDIYFEAAVCGGVPIIRALREGLASDRIEEFFGIVNGTSNYILSEMATGQKRFEEVLKEAQAHGYAEADPALDVGGGDACHKLAILLMLCFGASIPVKSIFVEGIDKLLPVDFQFAERFGYVIKPLVIGRAWDDGIEARVHPAMIGRERLLASVPGAKNALYVKSYALGPSMYYGAGAGMMPTAMAVVSDLIEVCRNIQAGVTGRLPMRSFQALDKKPLRPISALQSRYYMRFTVPDQPGVLGQITTILGRHQISISQVVQNETEAQGPVDVVVLTHEANEGRVQAALTELNGTGLSARTPGVIRIVS